MKPTAFALLIGLPMAVFDILPAWRLHLFSKFVSYGIARFALFALLVVLFRFLSRNVDIDLGFGNRKPIRTGYGDPLLFLRAMACFIVMIGHGTTVVFVPKDLVHVASE